MGRPKADDPKILTIRVRVTPQEKAQAKELADAMGVSVSNFLRIKIWEGKAETEIAAD